MLEYRPYQIDLINQIIQSLDSNYKSPLIIAPTASGKTFIMGGLLNRLVLRGFRRNLVVVPFTSIQDQLNEFFSGLNIPVKCLTYQAANNYTEPVDSLIFDECHHTMSPTGQNIIRNLSPSFICGLTATPYRIDSCPLLTINGGTFDTLIYGPTMEELTQQKYLADYEYLSYPLVKKVERTPLILHYKVVDYLEREYYSIDDKSDQIIPEYITNFKGMKGIVFCKNAEHASIVAENFCGIGIPTKSINCYRAKKETNATFMDFKENKLTLLTATNMASEGLDFPPMKLAMLARSIKLSLTMFIQQCGRVLRPYNNEVAKILDLTGNVYRFGDLQKASKKEIV